MGLGVSFLLRGSDVHVLHKRPQNKPSQNCHPDPADAGEGSWLDRPLLSSTGLLLYFQLRGLSIRRAARTKFKIPGENPSPRARSTSVPCARPPSCCGLEWCSILIIVATITSPTARTFARPIWVDLAQLKNLDAIIDRYSERLQAEHEKLLDEETDSQFSEYYARPGMTDEQIASQKASIKQTLINKSGWGKETRSLTVDLSHGRQLEVRDFTEAADHAGLDDEIPFGFFLFYILKPFKVRVSLNSSWEEKLNISTEPSEAELSRAIFGSLSNWGKDVAAPALYRKWFQLRWLFWMLLCLCLVVGVSLFIGGFNDIRSANIEAAHKLLDHGIDSSNESQALSLVLAIESEYGGKVVAATPHIRAWVYLGLVTGVFLMLSLCPGLAIGLWRGKSYLRICRWWARFVAITVPLFVFVTFIRPWLVSWLVKQL